MRCRTDETLRYVQFLARRFDKKDINAVILIVLFDLGFSPSSDGFGYLRRAIDLCHANSSTAITKGIYPQIIYSDGETESWGYVDQAIRRAIKTAWSEQDPEIWNLFFPPYHGKISLCPSNKEFIARIACIVELWQCCKEADYERAI